MQSELIEIIKEWVKIDNEIIQLRAEESKRKQRQKEMSKMIMTKMKEDEIDEYNLKDGKLKYSKKNVKQPITKKKLTEILTKYYNGNTEQADNLNNYIMDNREERIVEKLERGK